MNCGFSKGKCLHLAVLCNPSISVLQQVMRISFLSCLFCLTLLSPPHHQLPFTCTSNNSEEQVCQDRASVPDRGKSWYPPMESRVFATWYVFLRRNCIENGPGASKHHSFEMLSSFTKMETNKMPSYETGFFSVSQARLLLSFHPRLSSARMPPHLATVLSLTAFSTYWCEFSATEFNEHLIVSVTTKHIAKRSRLKKKYLKITNI